MTGGPRLVVLTGCSGGGKSTLLDALGDRGWRTVPEAGRQIVREALAADGDEDGGAVGDGHEDGGGDALPWIDMARFAERAARRSARQIGEALAACPNGWVVSDRSPVDVLKWFANEGRPMPAGLRGMLDGFACHPVVFAAPPWATLFRTDAERRATFEEAEREYGELVAAYRARGCTVVELPRQSVARRVALVERTLAHGERRLAGAAPRTGWGPAPRT